MGVARVAIMLLTAIFDEQDEDLGARVLIGEGMGREMGVERICGVHVVRGVG